MTDPYGTAQAAAEQQSRSAMQIPVEAAEAATAAAERELLSTFWPLVVGSALVTELGLALGLAATKLVPSGALAATMVAAPFAVKRAAAKQ